MKYLKGDEARISEAHLGLALDEARKALCSRAKCGAVIVKDGAVIGRGYNAPPRDDASFRMCERECRLPQSHKHDRTCCVHAEWRAINDALRGVPAGLSGSLMYFARESLSGGIEPSDELCCTVCSRLLADVGIKEFVIKTGKGTASYGAAEFNRASYDALDERG